MRLVYVINDSDTTSFKDMEYIVSEDREVTKVFLEISTDNVLNKSFKFP